MRIFKYKILLKNYFQNFIIVCTFLLSNNIQAQLTIKCGEPIRFLSLYNPLYLSIDSLPSKVKSDLNFLYGHKLMLKLKLEGIYCYNRASLLAINQDIERMYGVLPKYELKYSLPISNSFVKNYCGSIFLDSLWNRVSIYRGRDLSYYLPTKENLNSHLLANSYVIKQKLEERKEHLDFEQIKFYKNHICIQYIEKHFVSKKEAKRISLSEGDDYIIDHYQSVHTGEFIGTYVHCCGIIDTY